MTLVQEVFDQLHSMHAVESQVLLLILQVSYAVHVLIIATHITDCRWLISVTISDCNSFAVFSAGLLTVQSCPAIQNDGHSYNYYTVV